MTKSCRRIITYFAIAIIVALGVGWLYSSDILYMPLNQVNDIAYQRGNSPSGNISIIEIDEHSLDVLGPYQTWTRDYVAEAIETLNADPDSAPAVIGVDVLYIGNTSQEADEHLVSAASLNENVVFGSYVNADMELSESDGVYSLQQSVTLYEEPFEELLATSKDGFVNGFFDRDGIIRHGIRELAVADGEVADSFSYAVYKEYARKNNLSQEIDIPVNSSGFWYIDYSDGAGGYDSAFSLSDLIYGDIPVDYFTDGIVLIGPYAEGLMDSYSVPINKSQNMYGVEIHANMIEAMIDGRFKKEVPRWAMALLSGIIAAGLILICSRKSIKYTLIYSAVFVILFPITCIFLYGRGIVIDILFIPSVVFVITVVSVLFRYFRTLVEKHRVEGMFKRYVAPEIVSEIMKQGMGTVKLGGEAVECAILFVDIRGFTTMSELLEPEEVVSILNNYLELTSSSIFKYGGTLDKFIGDATMAIFGAPLPQEDYIYKAVCAAMDMVDRSYELAKQLEEKFGRSVSFGVGVHCGKAVVGNIGTQRRMDYTAIGDTVNTSARLEANAPKNTVYVSRKVVDALGDRIECESVGNIPLKGKSEELEVFKVMRIL